VRGLIYDYVTKFSNPKKLNISIRNP